jgi:hypothetical protein
MHPSCNLSVSILLFYANGRLKHVSLHVLQSFAYALVMTDDVSADALKKFKVEVDECGGTPVLLKKLLKYDKREQGTVTHHEFRR